MMHTHTCTLAEIIEAYLVQFIEYFLRNCIIHLLVTMKHRGDGVGRKKPGLTLSASCGPGGNSFRQNQRVLIESFLRLHSSDGL